MINIRIIVLLLSFCIASTIFANTEANFRKAIGGICASFAKAFETKNADWFDKNSTANLTYVNMQGKKQDRKEVLKGMKDMFSTARTVKAKVTCGAVRFLKGVGSHINTIVSTVTIPDASGKLHTMIATATTEDAFKWEGGKWKYFRVTEVKAPKYVLDGKPFNPDGGQQR